MFGAALEIETITLVKNFGIASVERDLQFTLEDKKKLLSFVRVGSAAAGVRSDTEKVRLHLSIPPGE